MKATKYAECRFNEKFPSSNLIFDSVDETMISEKMNEIKKYEGANEERKKKKLGKKCQQSIQMFSHSLVQQ